MMVRYRTSAEGYATVAFRPITLTTRRASNMPPSDLKAEEVPLLEFLRQEEAVLFVGSGISQWSGLPSWSQLLGSLLARCHELGGSTGSARAALDRDDLLTAASELCAQMSASEIAAVFRRVLRFGQAEPQEIHRLIFSLGIHRFITTNYDELLERQAAQSSLSVPFLSVTNRQLAELADIQKASAHHFIFKPHGDWETPKAWWSPKPTIVLFSVTTIVPSSKLLKRYSLAAPYFSSVIVYLTPTFN